MTNRRTNRNVWWSLTKSSCPLWLCTHSAWQEHSLYAVLWPTSSFLLFLVTGNIYYIQCRFIRNFWSLSFFKGLGFRATRSNMQIKSGANLFSIFHPILAKKILAPRRKNKNGKDTCVWVINWVSLFKANKYPKFVSVAKLISSFYVNWNATNPSCLSKNVLLHLVIFYRNELQ